MNLIACLITFDEKRGWIIRVHRIDEHDLDFHLPVFVFLFTKMKMKLKQPVSIYFIILWLVELNLFLLLLQNKIDN